MKQFDNILVEAISEGLTTEAIHTLRDAFEEFKEKYPENEEEIYDINNLFVLISSRHQELEKRELIGVISAADAKQERASIAYSFLEIVREMQQYANFMAYANKAHVTPIKPLVPLPVYKYAAASNHKAATMTSGGNKYKTATMIGGGVIGGFILLLIIGSSINDSTNTGTGTPTDGAAISLAQSNGNGGSGNAGISRQEAIIGTWQGVAAEALVDGAEVSQAVESLNSVAATVTYDFHADGTLDAYMGNDPYPGSYALADDGSAVSITDQDGTNHYFIDKLSAATLVLIDDKGQICIKFKKKE